MHACTMGGQQKPLDVSLSQTLSDLTIELFWNYKAHATGLATCKNSFFAYRRDWLIGACAYRLQQQENMRLLYLCAYYTVCEGLQLTREDRNDDRFAACLQV